MGSSVLFLYIFSEPDLIEGLITVGRGIFTFFSSITESFSRSCVQGEKVRRV